MVGLAWGGGFAAVEGDVLFFNNTKTDDTNWTSTIAKNGQNSVTNTFALSSKAMNDAPFAAELYGAWDFGPVVFKDITLVSNSSLFQTWSPSHKHSIGCHWNRHWVLHCQSFQLQRCH